MTQGILFVPTDEQRRTVRAMAGYGMPQMDIGTFLDIDAKTLRKHFTRELEMGSIEATTKVAQSLFRMATEGGSVAAAIFFASTLALAYFGTQRTSTTGGGVMERVSAPVAKTVPTGGAAVPATTTAAPAAPVPAPAATVPATPVNQIPK